MDRDSRGSSFPSLGFVAQRARKDIGAILLLGIRQAFCLVAVGTELLLLVDPESNVDTGEYYLDRYRRDGHVEVAFGM
jgi:hypothetical protein